MRLERDLWGYTALVILVLGMTARGDDSDRAAPDPIKVVQIVRKKPVVYQKDIEPIFTNKCSFCHAGKVKEADLDMSTYESLMKGGKSGKPIVPGKPADSLLVKLAGRTGKPPMPPKEEEPLSPEELALIKLWIEQGAKGPVAEGIARPETLAKIMPRVPPAKVTPVRALAVSPDKATVVVGRGNQIHLFDGKKGDHRQRLVDPRLAGPDKAPVSAAHLSLVESLAISLDSKTLASGSFREVVLWDLETGSIRQRLTGFADRVDALAFSPDGKYLAAGGGAPAENGEVRIYRLEDVKLVANISKGHSDTVLGVSFSPDSKKLATCGADKFVKVFEVPTGRFLKSFEGHSHHVLDVGWKSDGKLLASAGADNVVKVWDYQRGEQVRTIKAHSKQVSRLVFTGRNQFVTCSADRTVKVWNLDTGAVVRTLSGAKDFLHALAASPDGAVLVAGSEDGQALLYDGLKGRLVKVLSTAEPESNR